MTFRFINDPAAQVAALLAGDIDGMPRLDAPQAVKQFQADKRFTVEVGRTAGKGILAINNKKKPFDDVRVRRALMHAIDRKAFIDGVLEGFGKPIGSHFAPTDAGYVDLTGMYPYDPEKAKALLKEAGVTTPLNVTLTLPPPQYARKGGEVVAAKLAKVGVDRQDRERRVGAVARRPLQGQLRPDDHQPRRAAGLHAVRQHRLLLGLRQQGVPRPGRPSTRPAGNPKERSKLFGEMQRMLAADAVNAYIFNPAQVAVAKKGLKGLWAQLADLRQRHGRGVLAVERERCMAELHELGAAELAALYRRREAVAGRGGARVLAHIERCEPQLHALYASSPRPRWPPRAPARRAGATAQPLSRSTACRSRSRRTSPRAAAGAAGHRGRRCSMPAADDAPPAARLREAGAVMLAKTTMPDYGMLSSGLSSFHPLTRNPWDLSKNPGGSSAGAAAAAAAGYGPLHLGTDIGGSIRLPAGWCGVFGFKPSLGRIPIKPPYAGRVAGPMTRTVTTRRC